MLLLLEQQIAHDLPQCSDKHSAWLTGYVHPNLNIEDPEDDVDTSILVGAEKQQLDINVALSNSFGFGGHNSCVLFRKYVP